MSGLDPNRKKGIFINRNIIIYLALLIAAGTILVGERVAQEEITDINISDITSKAEWTADDVLKVADISSIDVSPDGKKVAYTVKNAVMTENESKYIYQTFISDSNGRNPVQITEDNSSLNPQWSPDGNWLAFLSSRSGEDGQDGVNNIWIISEKGGEAIQLTDHETGVIDFKWSPDGRMINFVAVDSPTSEEEKAIAQKDDAIIVGENIRMNHLWTVSFQKNSSGEYETRRITQGNFSVAQWDWSPDGGNIVFSHSPGPEEELASDISIVELRTGKITPLINTDASEDMPFYSPDGRWIAFTTAESLLTLNVSIIPANGGEPRPLAKTFDQQPTLIGWSPDNSRIYYSEFRGTTSVISVLPANGSEPEDIYINDSVAYNIKMNRARTMLGFAQQNTSKPAEAYISSIDSFKPVQVSSVNKDIVNISLLGRTEVIHWKSSDGKEIEGLLTYPVNYEPGKRYPLLLGLHGGPALVSSQGFIGSDYLNQPGVFSSMGYAVLRPNPRGSTGYGDEFRKANLKDWGGMDYQDVMTGVDHVIDMGVADPDQLGVLGWSYGGYMTAWIITHNNRFKAASVGAGVTDLISMAGTTELRALLPTYFGGYFWEDHDLYLSRSPIIHVGNATTPTLIQHGEEDNTVPVTQGIELYNAFKTRNIPVKMVIYPRSGHVPEEPKLIRDVINRRTEWFNTYIQEKN